ncbi:hypothetical protein E2C01_048319 [Portunus trituberculatus]|uniref:Uncharacterized protein n=1 Tax=Portunus trituberculatus TaxID=210409 RepID=A0A5B7GAU4_PORTR|nr:hypothetical protein [Portunus trituberculatus]
MPPDVKSRVFTFNTARYRHFLFLWSNFLFGDHQRTAHSSKCRIYSIIGCRQDSANTMSCLAGTYEQIVNTRHQEKGGYHSLLFNYQYSMTKLLLLNEAEREEDHAQEAYMSLGRIKVRYTPLTSLCMVVTCCFQLIYRDTEKLDRPLKDDEDP